MLISSFDRYKYIIERTNESEFFQAFNIYEEDGKKRSIRWCRDKSSAAKFDSLIEAREMIGKVGGGCRIMRYDLLTTESVDVWEEMRAGAERRWIRRAAED